MRLPQAIITDKLHADYLRKTGNPDRRGEGLQPQLQWMGGDDYALALNGPLCGIGLTMCTGTDDYTNAYECCDPRISECATQANGQPYCRQTLAGVADQVIGNRPIYDRNVAGIIQDYVG